MYLLVIFLTIISAWIRIIKKYICDHRDTWTLHIAQRVFTLRLLLMFSDNTAWKEHRIWGKRKIVFLCVCVCVCSFHQLWEIAINFFQCGNASVIGTLTKVKQKEYSKVPWLPLRFCNAIELAKGQEVLIWGSHSDVALISTCSFVSISYIRWLCCHALFRRNTASTFSVSLVRYYTWTRLRLHFSTVLQAHFPKFS